MRDPVGSPRRSGIAIGRLHIGYAAGHPQAAVLSCRHTRRRAAVGSDPRGALAHKAELNEDKPLPPSVLVGIGALLFLIGIVSLNMTRRFPRLAIPAKSALALGVVLIIMAAVLAVTDPRFLAPR